MQQCSSTVPITMKTNWPKFNYSLQGPLQPQDSFEQPSKPDTNNQFNLEVIIVNSIMYSMNYRISANTILQKNTLTICSFMNGKRVSVRTTIPFRDIDRKRMTKEKFTCCWRRRTTWIPVPFPVSSTKSNFWEQISFRLGSGFRQILYNDDNEYVICLLPIMHVLMVLVMQREEDACCHDICGFHYTVFFNINF